MRKKLHVLFLSSWYPSRVDPYLGNFVRKHAEATALHSEVSVLHVCADPRLSGKKYDYTAGDEDGIFTVNVYYRKPAHSVPLLSHLQKLLRYFRAHQTGLRIIEQRCGLPGLVHVNVLWRAGLVARWYRKTKGIPYLVTEHSTAYQPARGYRRSFFERIFSKRIAHDASVILTVSHNLKEAMVARGLQARYEIVYNVVNTAVFKPAGQTAKKNRFRLLHISTLNDHHKNISGMLRAIAELSRQRNDFEIRIMGEGDTSPHIRYAKELGLLGTFVFFDGIKTTAEVAGEMQQADCFVLFSNYENLPCVVLEAFSCGLPVIATNVGGIAEHVNEKRGLLVAPRDEKALVQAMNDVFNNLASGKYSKTELHHYASENFSYEKVSARLHEIYLKIFQQNNRPKK